MSRSKNQNRNAYNGRCKTGKEFWSKMCPGVNGFNMINSASRKIARKITNSFIRSQGKKKIKEEVREIE